MAKYYTGARFPTAVFDRDSIFAKNAISTSRTLGYQLKRTAYRSPSQNGVAKRWIGSCRRELLEPVIVLHAGHLRRLHREYVEYYTKDRFHLRLEKDAPHRRPT